MEQTEERETVVYSDDRKIVLEGTLNLCYVGGVPLLEVDNELHQEIALQWTPTMEAHNSTYYREYGTVRVTIERID